MEGEQSGEPPQDLQPLNFQFPESNISSNNVKSSHCHWSLAKSVPTIMSHTPSRVSKQFTRGKAHALSGWGVG